jgi:toxin-antitoxin system PIN domain toxin
MISTGALHLLDVNTLIARVFEDHMHHGIVTEWFSASGLEWAICPFTEAGFLRYATRRENGNLSVREATAILKNLAQHPGYHYRPVSQDWRTLTKPFFRRLHGYKQVTDAYLLGVAVQEGLVLVTFDRAILHLAGEHSGHVLMLSQ